MAILTNHKATVHEFFNHKTWMKSLHRVQVEITSNSNNNNKLTICETNRIRI